MTTCTTELRLHLISIELLTGQTTSGSDILPLAPRPTRVAAVTGDNGVPGEAGAPIFPAERPAEKPAERSGGEPYSEADDFHKWICCIRLVRGDSVPIIKNVAAANRILEQNHNGYGRSMSWPPRTSTSTVCTKDSVLSRQS